jgi:succinate dehydrogenase/fumarate reductase-like Fe-S protein
MWSRVCGSDTVRINGPQLPGVQDADERVREKGHESSPDWLQGHQDLVVDMDPFFDATSR